MMRRLFALALLAAAVAAHAQTPAATGIQLVSRVGFTPLQPGKTPQASPCASSSYTVDSKVYTVVIKVIPQLAGAKPSPTPNVWADAQNANRFYFLTGSAGIAQVKTSRRDYPAAFVDSAAEVVVPDLTWADAADILTELQKSPAAAGRLRSSVASSATLSLIPVTLDGTTLNDVMQALADRGARLHTPGGWSTAIQLLQAKPSPLAGVVAQSPVPLTVNAANITTEFDKAPADLNGLVNATGIRNAVQNTAANATGSDVSTLGSGVMFLVDSPCLTVEVLPSIAGSNDGGGQVVFDAHYLFPAAQGNSFLRFDVGGAGPLSGTKQTNSLTAAADAALNHDLNAAGMSGPIRFTGGLTTSYERATSAGIRTSKAAGGLKGSVSFPSLTQLTGNDTRPTFTIEAVGSSLHGTANDTSQIEGVSRLKAKFRWTPIFNSAVDGAYFYSRDPIYGGRKSNYLVTADVLRFIVRDPLEFTATWKCGRVAPDYKRVCGFFTGFSLTSSQ